MVNIYDIIKVKCVLGINPLGKFIFLGNSQRDRVLLQFRSQFINNLKRIFIIIGVTL